MIWKSISCMWLKIFFLLIIVNIELERDSVIIMHCGEENER